MTESALIKKERESGIELLKLLAITLIVIFHMTQTLCGNYSELPGAEGAFIDLKSPVSDPSGIFLMLFRNFGALGNHLFFVCSAWFLVSSKEGSRRKILQVVGDNWTLSVLFLILFLLAGQRISLNLMVKCLFPTTFGMNWYVTCYVLFYLMHPYINRMMDAMNQRELRDLSAALVFIYGVVPMVYPGLFFPSQLLTFLMIYMAVGYVKKYMQEFADNLRANVILFLFSAMMLVGVVVFFNVLGTKGIYVVEDIFRFLGWGDCVFNLTLALALLNIFRKLHFVSIVINRLSSLTLLIYLIHENVLFRWNIRPQIWIWLHNTFGYDYLVLLVLGLAIVVLIASVILACVYRCTIGKLVQSAVQKIFQ